MEGIKLTNDPLTNIKIMTPYLDEAGRAAASALMFGIELGKNMTGSRSKEKKELECEK